MKKFNIENLISSCLNKIGIYRVLYFMVGLLIVLAGLIIKPGIWWGIGYMIFAGILGYLKEKYIDVSFDIYDFLSIVIGSFVGVLFYMFLG